MYKIIMIIFGIFIFISAEAIGQSPKIAVGPQFGFQKASDADNMKIMYGAALRVKLSQGLGAEGSINYRQESYFNDDLTVRSWPVMITGLIYPIEIAYGAIGVGWYNTTFDFIDELNNTGVDDETRQKFGWHFGGGVQLPFGNTGSMLTGDIRYVFLDYEFDEVPGSGDTNANFFLITAGLLIGLN